MTAWMVRSYRRYSLVRRAVRKALGSHEGCQQDCYTKGLAAAEAGAGLTAVALIVASCGVCLDPDDGA
jgi:hypothetical protein